MTLHAWGAVLPVVFALQATPVPHSPVATIHGRIVAIDRTSGTFDIHHDPFPLMPMTMTMPVHPVHRGDLAKLHVGEIVDVTVDTSIDPWPGTNIHPARR